jgi:L-ribulose-5-phosphate 3-epimerase
MLINNRLGFMQGRLSPVVDGKIQAFPWNYWQEEFPLSQSLGLELMEWTIDQDRLYQNPLMTHQGQNHIRRLSQEHRLSIPSLTADCLMQSPFWKSTGSERTALEADFTAIISACGEVGIEIVVVPLVDNGRIEDQEQEKALFSFMLDKADMFRDVGVRIVFESDFAPSKLASFIGCLPEDVFGLNYDIGNSAALGYNPEDEFACYASRILHVHIKDRLLAGPTVPLGTGNANFPTVFRLLRQADYLGYLIMQTARAKNGDHAGAISDSIVQINSWATGA